MIPLERQAERQILAAVRREMSALFGERRVQGASDEQRLVELVHTEAGVWQQERVNQNLALVEDMARVEEQVMDWLVRRGPLEPLLCDPHIEEIFVNNPQEVGVIDRAGNMRMLPEVYFDSDQEVRELARRLLAAVGRRVDESQPMVDARLDDGSRLNVVIPPVSDGCTLLTIRTFRPQTDNLDWMVDHGTLPRSLRAFLNAAVRASLNIVISGPTGSGKTTLLNALGNECPATGRIVVIEPVRELRLSRFLANCLSLEAQEANAEGVGEITQRELVKNSLRMRPSRVIVGEVRGEEAFDLMRAMNTGHGGCLSTVHANSARDALDALITLGMMAPERPSRDVMAHLVSRSVNLVIQMEQATAGRRVISHVLEVTGMERDVISSHDLWALNGDGRVRWTGMPPKCLELFARRNITYTLPAADGSTEDN